MRKNMQKTIIATSIAALFIAPVAAFAKDKDKWEYHEDQWNQVMSYGNIPLSQDSAGIWGPWAEFVQPAAGGPAVGFMLQVDGERYRPLPPVKPVPPPVADTCAAGTWCGYAAYINESYSYGEDSYSNTGHHPGRIALTLSPSGEDEGEGAAKYKITGFSGEPAPFRGESDNLPSEFYGQIGDFYASDYTENTNTWIDGGEGGYFYDTSYVTHGSFGSYLSGDGGESATYGSYVAGIVTPLADIVALGNVEATYHGYTVYPHGGYNNFDASPVVINVNFGNATWNGTWNGGVDGNNVHTHIPDSAGITHLYGNVGFTAQGTISGANIQSTSVGTNDYRATVSGQVQGNFVGSQAAAIIGISDITKTRPASDSPGAVYTDARNVDLFVANKVSDVK